MWTATGAGRARRLRHHRRHDLRRLRRGRSTRARRLGGRWWSSAAAADPRRRDVGPRLRQANSPGGTPASRTTRTGYHHADEPAGAAGDALAVAAAVAAQLAAAAAVPPAPPAPPASRRSVLEPASTPTTSATTAGSRARSTCASSAPTATTAARATRTVCRWATSRARARAATARTPPARLRRDVRRDGRHERRVVAPGGHRRLRLRRLGGLRPPDCALAGPASWPVTGLRRHATTRRQLRQRRLRPGGVARPGRLPGPDHTQPGDTEYQPSADECWPAARDLAGDGICDDTCNNAACNFDNGDCEGTAPVDPPRAPRAASELAGDASVTRPATTRRAADEGDCADGSGFAPVSSLAPGSAGETGETDGCTTVHARA